VLMSRSVKKKFGGFTLIELLVGLTVGAIVLIGVIFSWALAVRNNAYVLSVAALNNDLRSVTQIISQDVRRAAEHPNSASRVPGIVEVGNSCIAFYAAFVDDDDPNSFDDFVPSAYRLNQGSLEIWDPASSQTPRCDPSTPEFNAAGNWEVLLGAGDRGISLAAMNFDVSESLCLDLNIADDDVPGRCPVGATDKLELLLVQLQLTGRMQISGAERLLQIQDQVKVRNELLL
jgi:prepilin-type N-terminal cleavage/methylation domain-containing protein